MRGEISLIYIPMHRVIAREMSNFQILNLIKQIFVKEKNLYAIIF